MRFKRWQDMPIGGIILDAGNSVQYHTGDWRAFRPVFGEAACTHCFLCWLYCPDSSIVVDAENERMLGFDLDHCKGCGICAAVCPVNAKVKRQSADMAKDDERLCIRLIEEPRGEGQ